VAATAPLFEQMTEGLGDALFEALRKELVSAEPAE
jgi:hypothetical protein